MIPLGRALLGIELQEATLQGLLADQAPSDQLLHERDDQEIQAVARITVVCVAQQPGQLSVV